MGKKEQTLLPILPKAETTAFFPPTPISENLQTEVLRRTGVNNIVYALQYGSFMTGDPTKTSMLDMIVVVEDTKSFHQRNMNLHSSDYGLPHLVIWHNWLNKFSFNFYHTVFPDGEKLVRIKYGVISRENFIKGCNGTLAEKEKVKIGDFGLYIAGRMQKVALNPFLKSEKPEKVAEIEEAINTARIDGIWLSLGLLGNEFNIDELMNTYISLSYKADLRIEKKGKVETIMKSSYGYYKEMLEKFLSDFQSLGIVENLDENKWRKNISISKKEAKGRINWLKLKMAKTNYGKNVLTVGPKKGIVYVWEKGKRALGPRISKTKENFIGAMNDERSTMINNLFPS